jgi:DNA repair protein RecO (recombination protein O)
MSEHIRVQAIVLRRQSYGEADRIITLLTPELGKVAAIVKGARRLESKLAGGIELLCENEISLLPGRKELFTVVSARQVENWENLLSDYERLETAYELIKLADTTTEDHEGQQTYASLRSALYALNDKSLSVPIIEIWYYLQLLRQHGQQPDLARAEGGIKLDAAKTYRLDMDHGVLVEADSPDTLNAEHIKLWRVCLTNDLEVVMGIGGVVAAATESLDTCRTFTRYRLDHKF